VTALTHRMTPRLRTSALLLVLVAATQCVLPERGGDKPIDGHENIVAEGATGGQATNSTATGGDSVGGGDSSAGGSASTGGSDAWTGGSASTGGSGGTSTTCPLDAGSNVGGCNCQDSGSTGGSCAYSLNDGRCATFTCAGVCQVVPSSPPSPNVPLPLYTFFAFDLSSWQQLQQGDEIAVLGAVVFADPKSQYPATFRLALYSGSDSAPTELLGTTKALTAPHGTYTPVEGSLSPFVTVPNDPSVRYWIGLWTEEHNIDDIRLAVMDVTKKYPVGYATSATCLPLENSCQMPELLPYNVPSQQMVLPYLYAKVRAALP
jgi:hypothetical protein